MFAIVAFWLATLSNHSLAATNWQSVNPTPGADAVVHAILHADGGVYVAGEFASIADRYVPMVAFWNGSEWLPLGEITEVVYALAKNPNGGVYAGGQGGVKEWDGATWTQVGASGATPSPVHALDVTADGRIYAAGRAWGGTYSIPAVASFNGTTWQPLGAGINETVYALRYVSDDEIYIGGTFSQTRGAVANRAARWNGSEWLPLSTGTDGPVRSIVPAPDGAGVYFGGPFIYAGGRQANGVAYWNGSQWESIGSASSGVTALAFDLESNSLLVGANTAGGVRALRKWQGGEWSSLAVSITGTINTICICGDRGSWVGGEFEDVGLRFRNLFRLANDAPEPVVSNYFQEKGILKSLVYPEVAVGPDGQVFVAANESPPVC